MTEKLVFVFDKQDFIKFNQIKETKKDVLVICGEYSILEKCKKNGINCKMIYEYELSDIQIAKPIEWIKTWPDKTLQDKKSFKEIFSFNGTSIFWYLEGRLYHKRIHHLITKIEQLKKILQVERPKKIIVINDKESYDILLHLHTDVEYIKDGDKKLRSNISDNSYSGFLTLKLILLKIVRGFISSSKSNNVNSILFLTEVGSWRKLYDYNSNTYQYEDVFFQNIIKKVKKENQVEVIDFENNPKRLWNSYSLTKKRVKSFQVPVTSWEKFLTIKTILKSRKAYNKFKKIWNDLKKSDKFKESLNFEGVPIYDLVIGDFDELFNSFKALAAIAMIETAERIIKVKKPSIIVMHDEYGALQMSFLYASKKFKISTLSLQHGTIYQNAFAYTHKDSDINNDVTELDFPLPDRMCVWSESAKNALITSAKFPITVPIVTGDPKMDSFNQINNKFKREKILKNLKIPSNKKIILFATENLPSIEERDLISHTIFESISMIKDCFFIVKVHPNETDISKYQKIAEKFKISSYMIIKDANLYELIHVSDVVIISYSTVGLEAMRMSKPVISLNLMGYHNESIIIKNNLANVVRTKEELIPTITELLGGQNKEKIEESRIFAEQEIGSVNQDATEKIVKNILELKSSENRF